ncbi:MAG TPA: thymidine phosphorylase [Patescibacteria group bacterium]|nr:thymidine phosphorylase [Patescibacteria group bacterium]
MEEKNLALEAIRKKLVGKELNYKEIFAIMDEIAKDKLGEVLTTYFVASGYSEGFSSEELYYLTKAMVETGEHLSFRGVVADKHSIGGVPGARVTLILVPIIASAGFKIPKSSSRAITTPAGTADAMEVIANVTFTKDQILKIVEETNACIVWGGSFKIAPADDEIIKIEEPLLFESFDKVVVSVMAKKVAFGSTHVVIDLPYGKWVKLRRLEDAEVIKKKFEFIAHKFGLKLKTFVHEVKEPAGNGIGPLLETRDSLMVLEQLEERPKVLEEIALDAAADLLALCLPDANESIKDNYHKKYKNTREWAEDMLKSGKALEKMREIIKAQGGKPNIKSSDLKPGDFCARITSDVSGKIKEVSSKNITIIAKILGAPAVKEAGLFLEKRLGDEVKNGEVMFSLYSDSEHSLKEAINSINNFPIYEIS